MIRKIFIAFFFIVIFIYFFNDTKPFIHSSSDSKTKITLKINKKTVAKGKKIKLKGKISPSFSNLDIVILKKKVGKKRFKPIATVKTNANGKFKIKRKIKRSSIFKAKAIFNGNTIKSKKRRVLVTRTGGCHPVYDECDEEIYGDCGSNNTFFNVSPIQTNRIQEIIPLGNLNPPGGHVFPVDHIYIHIKPDPIDNSALVPLHAPGNIWIVNIERNKNITSGVEDYSIFFRTCNQFIGYFYHVPSLSEKIMAEFTPPYTYSVELNTGNQRFKVDLKDVNIAIEAGEIIGMVGNINGPSSEYDIVSFDMGCYDTRIAPLFFVNPYILFPTTLYTVCPLDYFDAELSAILKSHLGYFGTKRTIEPICGTISQDVADTAQGIWYLKGTNEQTERVMSEDEHLALVHDNIDPSKGVFSVGNSFNNVQTGRYFFTPSHNGKVNRDFDEIISDGSTYCYEVEEGFTFILQLTSNITLRIEKQANNSCGSGPWSFNTEYIDFER